MRREAESSLAEADVFREAGDRWPLTGDRQDRGRDCLAVAVVPIATPRISR